MAQSKVLIADDNPEIRNIIKILLTSEGYSIIEAKDGQDVLDKIREDMDLIILDIMMPKLDGYQTCNEIRKTSNVPILFLTAKSQDSDKMLGFASGGDDYLPKPFSYNELTSRVKALLRRYQVYKGKKEEKGRLEVIYIENIKIDIDKEIVYKDNQLLKLTDIEFEILKVLGTHRKQIFSAEQLYEKVWQEAYYYSANNTVMVHIRNLRKKIEKDAQNPKIIKTVWAKGYRCD